MFASELPLKELITSGAVRCLIIFGLACATAPASVLGQAVRPSPVQPATPVPQADSLETRFWNAISDSKTASDYRTYLEAYPNGQFAGLARQRLQQLEGVKPNVAAPAPPIAKPGAPATAGAVRDCPQCPALVLIPAGAFNMGSTEVFPFEAPVHAVTIRRPFFIGQREVTLEEWEVCVSERGCTYSPGDRGAGRGQQPVTNVSWTDTQMYISWLSKKTSKTYRLPSESEWEYAARAGATTSYPWGRSMEKNQANCAGCNGDQIKHPIATGSFPPNKFGLFDMTGNAAEWVADCWNDSFRSAPADGSVWDRPRCQERVLRGGSFNNDARYVRSASRFKYDFDVRYYSNGFRVARDN